MAGCERLPAGEEFYEIKIAPEKLRQIETLDLEKAEAEERDRPDANEVPPKELGLTLEQCRALTMENNLDLKVQLISPAIAAERVSEEEARLYCWLEDRLFLHEPWRPGASSNRRHCHF
ncbi:MAG: hypothetical protein ACYTEO_09240 [Planctomycetota bacterium]